MWGLLLLGKYPVHPSIKVAFGEGNYHSSAEASTPRSLNIDHTRLRFSSSSVGVGPPFPRTCGFFLPNAVKTQHPKFRRLPLTFFMRFRFRWLFQIPKMEQIPPFLFFLPWQCWLSTLLPHYVRSLPMRGSAARPLFVVFFLWCCCPPVIMEIFLAFVFGAVGLIAPILNSTMTLPREGHTLP